MLVNFSQQKNNYHGWWWLSVAKLIMPLDGFIGKESCLRLSAAFCCKKCLVFLWQPSISR